MPEMSQPIPRSARVGEEPLQFLNATTIQKIDQALCRVGEFGEVVLVVVKGQLRFIQITQSENIKEP